MTDNNLINPEFDRDQHLADFTDRALENQAPGPSEDPSMRALEEIVLVMKDHSPADAADDVRQKIKQNAQAAYAEIYLEQKKSGSKRGVFDWFSSQKGYQSQRQRRKVFAAQVSFAVIVLLAAVALFFPASGTPGGFSGAATGEMGFWLPVGILVLVGFALAWMWLKKD